MSVTAGRRRSAGSGADFHYANEAHFLRLRERARDYQRNDCIVGQAVRRLTASVVQDGFTLDVQTGDAELDEVLAERCSLSPGEMVNA